MVTKLLAPFANSHKKQTRKKERNHGIVDSCMIDIYIGLLSSSTSYTNQIVSKMKATLLRFISYGYKLLAPFANSHKNKQEKRREFLAQ
jgi:hypothetical protein